MLHVFQYHSVFRISESQKKQANKQTTKQRKNKKTYPGLLQTPKMEHFTAMVKGFYQLTIIAHDSTD